MESNLAEVALLSEKMLFGDLPPVDFKQANKELLGKAVQMVSRAEASRLLLINGDQAWQQYFELRLEVERPFGITADRVEKMVQKMRQRQARLNIDWYFFLAKESIVGAVGLLMFTHSGSTFGRLQDVDIFPQHQHQGFGNELLAAIEKLAAEKGVTYLFLGADEDDWPNHWYKRRGYQSVGVVAKVSE